MKFQGIKNNFLLLLFIPFIFNISDFTGVKCTQKNIENRVKIVFEIGNFEYKEENNLWQITKIQGCYKKDKFKVPYYIKKIYFPDYGDNITVNVNMARLKEEKFPMISKIKMNKERKQSIEIVRHYDESCYILKYIEIKYYPFVYDADTQQILIINKAEVTLNYDYTGTLEIHFKNNIKREKLKIYPNPAQKGKNIKIDLMNGKEVKIYNISGKMIKKTSVDNGYLNIQDLNCGIYIVVYKNNDTIYSGKIAIK